MIDLEKIYSSLSHEIKTGLECGKYDADNICYYNINYEAIINNTKPNCPDLDMFVDHYDKRIIEIFIERIAAQYEMVEFKFVSDSPKQIDEFYDIYIDGKNAQVEFIAVDEDDYICRCTRYFLNEELLKYYPNNIIEQN